MNAFDKNLKRLRKQRNMKQEELAERLHVTRQTVSGWETGRRQPDLDMLPKLAEALNADINELIYGSKPEAYPRFQRKYVICSAVAGGIWAALLLFRLLILPYLKPIMNTYHLGLLLTICYYLLPQTGSFAFGSFFPSLVYLWTPVRMKKRDRIWCLAGGLTALLPVISFWLGILPWSRWILYQFGEALLIYVLPALSGSCIMLGMICQVND